MLEKLFEIKLISWQALVLVVATIAVLWLVFHFRRQIGSFFRNTVCNPVVLMILSIVGLFGAGFSAYNNYVIFIISTVVGVASAILQFWFNARRRRSTTPTP